MNIKQQMKVLITGGTGYIGSHTIIEMIETGKYKLGFDMWGLILFFIIMIPNCIWFALPAPNDLLRSESVTPTVDIIASVFQVIMVTALCVIINKRRQKPMKRIFIIGTAAAVVFYVTGWILYYAGIVHTVIILDLCVAPCVSFALFSAGRKNAAALLAVIVFTICHIIYGIANFII